MKEKLKSIGQNLKYQIDFYRNLAKDNRVPRFSKILIGAALFYFLLPFDLIPDFIPVIGHLDDLVVIPLLIYMALKLIPDEIIEEAKQKGKFENGEIILK